jgi:hypothetical protein
MVSIERQQRKGGFMKSRSASCLVTAIFAFSLLLAAATHAAQYLELTARQKERAFSPAVITEGGKTVWLAGHAGLEDASGKSLAGDFDAQVRAGLCCDQQDVATRWREPR